MMNIEDSVRWVIDNFEGHFFTDDPIDSGGATKFGITLRTLQYSRRIRSGNFNLIITKNDVKNLTLDEAVGVGVSVFAIESKINLISDWKLRLLVYDYGFHSGQNRAISILQRLIHVKDDGIIGSMTLNAINSFPNSLLLTIQLLTKREEFMQELITKKPSQRKYLFGWWKRTTKLQNVISELN